MAISVDEILVAGWSRRRADRFAAALARALPAAIDRAGADVDSSVGPADPTAAADQADELRITLTAAERRQPERAAAAVAATIAGRVTGVPATGALTAEVTS